MSLPNPNPPHFPHNNNNNHQLLTPQNSRPQKMYGQILHEIPSSSQSSDILLSQDSFYSHNFRSAEQQISNVSLFHDLPLKLLEEPYASNEATGEPREKLFQGTREYFIFDSVVGDRELMEQEIEENRKNAVLKSQIDRLQAEKRYLKQKLIEARSKKTSYQNIEKQFMKIYQNKDLKVVTIKDKYQPKQWFKNYNPSMQNRQKAIKIMQQQLQKNISALQVTNSNLQQKFKHLDNKNTNLQKQIEQRQKQMKKYRQKKKQQLISDHIEKQDRYIENLKESIAKIRRNLQNKR